MTSILRKKRRARFVVVDLELVEDARLSWKARMVLIYLLSRPPDWVVMVTDLVNKSPGGKEAVQSALAELRKLGYAKLVTIGGGGRRWEVAETPALFTGEVNGTTEGFPGCRNDNASDTTTGFPGCRPNYDDGVSPTTGFPAATYKGVVNKEGIEDVPEFILNDEKRDTKLAEAAILQGTVETILGAYPKKSRLAKVKMLRIIVPKLRKHGFELIMDAVKAYARANKDTPEQFIAYPENYFRGDRFLAPPLKLRTDVVKPKATIYKTAKEISEWNRQQQEAKDREWFATHPEDKELAAQIDKRREERRAANKATPAK